MTSKERADDLFQKLLPYIDGSCTEEIKHNTKQCALIAVDEIIDAVDWHEFEVPNDVLHYYFEVKQEIEKI